MDCSIAYQSLGRMSPPDGVKAMAHVTGLIPAETKRTLPSMSPTLMPEVCQVVGMAELHCEFVGWTWNLEAVPRAAYELKRGSHHGFHTPCAHRVRSCSNSPGSCSLASR